MAWPRLMREEQEAREEAAREAALGRRVEALKAGRLGPVMRRWVNADVSPVATLLRGVAVAYGRGDMAEVGRLLDTPAAEVADLASSKERPLAALMEWCLRGRSPGRAGELTTHADDIVLAFMAATLPYIATTDKKHKPRSLSAALAQASEAVRDTVMGQFVVSIQGATAMQAVREKQPELWMQKKALNRICAQLAGTVRTQLREEEAGLRTLKVRGHKKVLTVADWKGRERMLSLVPPDAVAWEVMSLCWSGEDSPETHPNRSLWLAFVAVLLDAAQVVGGWFDITETRTHRKGHTRKTKHLILSERAHEAITRDAERWVSLGFQPEPMLVPPEDGDYLTVKHRKITGQQSPLGLTTDPQETTAWTSGACALADTPWTVNPYSLDNPSAGETEDPVAAMRIAAHRRIGTSASFYLPVTMDFRGRVYYRTNWVTPQSGDLGKSLLAFPQVRSAEPADDDPPFEEDEAFVMHMAGLYGGPEKVDKKPYVDRLDWWLKWQLAPSFDEADKPLTLKAHYDLWCARQEDRIPIQLDGTCNGLQHLSALFRDEEGAKHVNLTRSTLEEAPADIYGVVAEAAKKAFGKASETESWTERMWAAGVRFDRSLCKKPVMVLPYGGTREAVRMSVKASLLERLEGTIAAGPEGVWRSYSNDGYGAFKDRDLADHPLFNQDAGLLAGLIWDCISPVIPKAMAAMGALRGLASYVGERGLSWRVGTGPEEARLWVTQAKSKAARKQVTMRGYHMPDKVRRLTLNAHLNEVDPKAHSTGIVANFIHSQDAAHLAASVAMFRAAGGGCVGSVHDCVMVRPSEAALMGRCLRQAFVDLYTADPLSQPVRLMSSRGVIDEEFPSWYAFGEAASAALIKAGKPGVVFPERGTFDINEVEQSAWFFS